MAWYKENSVLRFGKYKGKKVSEITDSKYICDLHHSTLNVYFIESVLNRLNIENKGKHQKQTK
jgi:hypothetical protein